MTIKVRMNNGSMNSFLRVKTELYFVLSSCFSPVTLTTEEELDTYNLYLKVIGKISAVYKLYKHLYICTLRSLILTQR